MATPPKTKLAETKVDVSTPGGIVSVRVYTNQGNGQTIRIELPKASEVKEQLIHLGGSGYIQIMPRKRYRKSEL